MIVYDISLEKDLTEALKVSYLLQEKQVIEPNQVLENQLLGLSMGNNWDYPDTVITWLMSDFAPYSFYFQKYHKTDDALDVGLAKIEQMINGRNKYLTVADVLQTYGYQYWYNGGLIFHGKHDRGGDGGSPTFSVNLSPVNGWSIHT